MRVTLRLDGVKQTTWVGGSLRRTGPEHLQGRLRDHVHQVGEALWVSPPLGCTWRGCGHWRQMWGGPCSTGPDVYSSEFIYS